MKDKERTALTPEFSLDHEKREVYINDDQLLQLAAINCRGTLSYSVFLLEEYIGEVRRVDDTKDQMGNTVFNIEFRPKSPVNYISMKVELYIT